MDKSSYAFLKRLSGTKSKISLNSLSAPSTHRPLTRMSGCKSYNERDALCLPIISLQRIISVEYPF